MKKELIPERLNQYKASLHTHTNLSDGNLSPAELAKAYKDHGYSVLAITDHEFFADHSDLGDKDFLMLTGYELQLVDPTHPRKPDQKCCHICLISKKPHEMKHLLFNPNAYDLRRLCRIPEKIPEMQYVGDVLYEKYYDIDLINEVAKLAKENGMLASYNHPVWSLEREDTYAHLRGFYAMEIFNNDCVVGGRDEYNPGIYDVMLRSGHRLGCIATDDAHSAYPVGHPRCDMFGGWTQILADSLDYDAIIAALEKGDFYASTGPVIRSMYCEDGNIHVKTDKAQSISMTTAGRRADTVRANIGDFVTEAVFPVKPDDGYVRVTVKDVYGRPANTRGYFLDELEG